MCEQAIVDICNQIAGTDNESAPRFSTLADIRKQPFIEGVYGLPYYALVDNGDFMVNLTPDKSRGGYSCKFFDTVDSKQVTLVLDADGKLVSYGLETRLIDFSTLAEGSIFTFAQVDSEYSSGSTHMQFSNDNIIYTDAKITGKLEIPMGKYSFFVPTYDSRLVDHATHRELFKVIYDLSDNPEDYEPAIFTFHCYISRTERNATMNMSQANFGLTDLKPVAITIDFSDGLELDFENIEESKKDSVMDLIMPLIDAAI